MNESFDTSVLIVGAGPVGLALAIELGRRDISCLVVDKRDGVLHVPKMSVVSTRNMEFCRRWGIAEEVRTAVWDSDRKLDFLYVDKLRGRELARLPVASYNNRDPDRPSPEVSAHCPQIFFDPMLQRLARQRKSVTLSYETGLEGFEQDDVGVSAILAKGGADARKIRARYLVGCDGATGIVREALGIRLDGRGSLANSVNLYFRSPGLVDMHDKGWARIYRLVDEAGCWGELIPIDGEATWRLTVFNEPAAARAPDTYMRRMLGAGFPYEMINVSHWERRDFVAGTFQSGRVFIAGDAAHQCSPTSGLGMATGVEDAINLGWKLAGALAGWGGTRLLVSYSLERMPIARRNVELSTRAYTNIAAIPPWRSDSDPAMLESWRGGLDRYTTADHVKLQYTYEVSPICALDGTPADDPEPKLFAPTSRPGARAPHVWLADGRSTLDHFDDGFTLIRLGAAPPSGESLLTAARARGLPIHEAVIDDPVARDRYQYALVLVRPDGHVAWRGASAPANPMAIVDQIRGI